MSVLALSVFVTTVYLNFVRPDNITTTEKTTTEATSTTGKPTTTTKTYPPLTLWGYDVHCKFQPDSHICHQNFHTRWYYDIKMEDCKSFKYHKCKSQNNNNYMTAAECRDACQDSGPAGIEDTLPTNAACHLQPDFGDCQDYIQMYYYDISQKRCLGFAYSGCGGNQNRFYDDKTCASVCGDAVDFTPLK